MNTSPVKTAAWKIWLIIGVISITGNTSISVYTNTIFPVLSIAVVEVWLSLPHFMEGFFHSGKIN
jgi:hypothetical protein